MDELIVFRAKLKRTSVFKAGWWALIFVAKSVADKIIRKVKRKGSVVIPASSLIDRTKLTINKLNFLSHDNNPAAITIPAGIENLFGVGHDDQQYPYLAPRFREAPFLMAAGKDVSSLKKNITTWISQNEGISGPAWHPYTVSERIVHWCWTLHFATLHEIRDKVWEQIVSESLIRHSRFLSNNFEHHLGHHNHLINNARALLTAAAMFSDFPESNSWEEKAIKTINNELPYQILDDGVHSEQSTSYHFLMTRTVWELSKLFEQRGREFTFDTALDRMIFYAKAIIRPDNSIPLLGHITPDWPVAELIGLLPIWTESAVHKSSLASLYWQEDHARISPREISKPLFFPNAGQAFISNEYLNIAFSCDPRFELKTHGDQNVLGIDVWVNGTALIRDAGLDSYGGHNQNYFESAKGQSTFVIDDVEPIIGSWRRRQLPKSYFSATSEFVIDSANNIVKARHNAYDRIAIPAHCSRTIRCSDLSTLFIVDEILGNGKHLYSARFHFGSNIITAVTDRSFEIADPTNGQRFLFTWTNATLENIQLSLFATDYGVTENGSVATFSTSFDSSGNITYKIDNLH